MYTSQEARVARLLFVCSLACLLLPSVSSLAVTPANHQLNNPQDEVYTYVYSILNNDPQPRSLELRLEPFSTYLEAKVAFSADSFTLLPGEAENVQLSVQPSGLGPQTHTLVVGVYDGGQRLTTFELLILVPGEAVEDYQVSLVAADTHSGAAVPLSIKLSNYGNVIGYAKLVLDIKQRDVVLDTISYPDLIQVLPNSNVEYDLVYTQQLEPGFYAAVISGVFSNENTTAEDQFSVQLEQTTQRIELGSDLELTFASLGHPASISYTLADADGREVAAGSFLPNAGDVFVPTSTLAAGTYELTLRMPSGEQHITVIIRDAGKQLRMLLLLVVGVVLLYAAFSLRSRASLAWRLFLLERAITRRQDEVANLINRSHRLVDRYTAHARYSEAGGNPRAPDERPR